MYRISNRLKNQRTIMIAAAALIVILLVVIALLFVKFNSLNKTPEAATEATSQKIIEQVGNLYLLPSGEEPTVAQVKDKQKLKDQPFFEKAQNGDYILVYSKNKLALIYRESKDQLINVGPINTEGVAGESTGTQQQPQNP